MPPSLRVGEVSCHVHGIEHAVSIVCDLAAMNELCKRVSGRNRRAFVDDGVFGHIGRYSDSAGERDPFSL